MRPRLGHLILCALALAGCGSADAPEAQANSAAELENRIAALAEHKEEKVERPPRMGVLQQTDLGAELRSDPACRLHRDGRLLVVVNAAGAVARIDGRRTPLTVSGPVGPTGGFFTAPGVTISVGRIAPYSGDSAVYVPGWPARASVGGVEGREIEKVEGRWHCSGR
jgi:hypothetical protein